MRKKMVNVNVTLLSQLKFQNVITPKHHYKESLYLLRDME